MMTTPAHHVTAATLLADLGGTNARFALFDGERVGPVARLAVADHASLPAAIASVLAPHAGRPVRRAVLAIAGPVENNRADFTNADWVADAGELAAAFGFASVRLINDFEAQAWALPHLRPEALHPLGGGTARAGAPLAVLGPGTGLGAAAWIPAGSLAVASEGGHVTLPGTSAREDAVIGHLRARLGHVSAESVLSGPGLVNLHDAVAALDGSTHTPANAAEITAAADTCPACGAALEMFCAMLGTIAGNVALSFGARGGVFIAGGIAPRILGALERSAFRERFEAKGRFQDYLAAIPVRVVLHPNPALVGLAAIAQAMDAEDR